MPAGTMKSQTFDPLTSWLAGVSGFSSASAMAMPMKSTAPPPIRSQIQSWTFCR